MLEYWWLLPLGFVAGVIGSMIGLGGGFVVVPVLTFFGFSPTLAASNSLFAAFSNSIASSVSYAKQKRIVYSLGLKLALLSIPGTVVGAYVSDIVSPPLFKLLFGAVLIASGVYIYMRRKMESREHSLSKQVMLLAAGASFFGGIVSSLFGIGGGTVFVPLMVIAIGLSMKLAAPTSQFILMFTAASGMIVHSLMGHPNYFEAGMLSIGSFLGGLVGSRLSTRVNERRLRLFVTVILGASALKLVLDALAGPF
ncbi:MAG: sulfite exporter TauE/SafE family protein [Thaumarchaeota archaeon]|nr:sulfite exporter TauE/SafE family protein [Nitrososphaerota archaeon]